MKRTTLAAIILAISLIAAGCTPERYAQYDRRQPSAQDTLAMMKKQDVISMSKAGVSDSLIITMMDVSNSWFQLKPQDVIDLKNAGVSDRVIDAMIETNSPSSEINSSTIASREYGYSYPPYYWYGGYYPYWYYPSFSFGYYYRPVYNRHVGFYGHSYFGSYGYRGGMRGGGRRR